MQVRNLHLFFLVTINNINCENYFKRFGGHALDRFAVYGFRHVLFIHLYGHSFAY